MITEIIRYNSVDKCFVELVQIKIEAMRDSLEAIGRFDTARAEERLINTFRSDDCYLIINKQQIVGFFIYFEDDEFIKLEHLYVVKSFQGAGLGTKCLNVLKDEALHFNKPIRLFALKHSPSSIFYKRHGFIQIWKDVIDNVYEWLQFKVII